MKPDLNHRFELRKDISTPNGYTRAGKILTGKEWKKLYPGCLEFHWREWFIDLDKVEPEPPKDELRELVREVFKERGLRSLSYMDAAVEVVNRWEKRKK